MDADTLPYPAAGTGCAYKNCRWPAWLSCPEGKCLFHSPYNGRLDAAARAVWETARRMAQAGDCDFARWHFPPDPDLDPDAEQGGFSGATFSGDTWFRGATFSAEAWFLLATFSGRASFHGAMFSGEARFDGATFRDYARFEDATFSGYARFDGAAFSSTAWFVGATFSSDARFSGATFREYAWFAYATFSGCAFFGDATFSRYARFAGATFSGNAWFKDATFSGDAGFEDATFSKVAVFQRAMFEGTPWFEGARCLGSSITFDRPRRWPWMRPRPFARPREGEIAYRLAKQAAQERGDYTEAGRYHYAEQCAIDDRLMHGAGVGPRFHGLVRLLFGRGVFGYGERPWHPLLLGLAVIMVCALVFACVDGVAPDPKSAQTSLAWWQYGYFSVVTFTTLGYGDYQPKQGWPQVVAGVEAALGAALLATFVVCLTRKYMR